MRLYRSPLWLATLVGAMVVLACQPALPPVAEADDAPDTRVLKKWSVSLESYGGIGGTGEGSVEVRNDGRTVAIDPQGNRCEEILSGENFSAVARAVVGTDPEEWEQNYEPPASSGDLFRWDLTVDRDGEQTSSSWTDASEIPADLERLKSALQTSRSGVLGRCRGTATAGR
jgi:hypothetical protein